ncbi:MAG: hypothetical protein ACO3TI_03185 [Aquiluna sp.]|jgi:hypothetical protein
MSRGSVKRDRHGRGMRRPLPSKLFKHGTRTSFFDAVVSETCEYLRETFSELAELNYRIEDVPLIEPGESLKRFSTRRSTMTITLYRLPIERLGKRRIPDPRIHIEQAVLAAAAALIDKDPWELVHPDN